MKCPYCKSPDTEFYKDFIDETGDKLMYEMQCIHCGKLWWRHYEFRYMEKEAE